MAYKRPPTPPTGHLLYGYDLGSPGRWHTRRGPEGLCWQTASQPADEIPRRLLEASGVSLADADTFRDNRQMMLHRTGVMVVQHGNLKSPHFALAAWHEETAALHESGPAKHDAVGLKLGSLPSTADADLRRALEVLEFEPSISEPRWLLTVSYG